MAAVRIDDFPGVLRDTARSLRLAGDVDLSRQLRKGIGDATRPALDDIREGLRQYMPNRYADVLAVDLRLTTSKQIAGKGGARVILRGTSRGPKRRRIVRLNEGVLWHMLFGDRKRWFIQGVRPGFFTKPIVARAPEIRRDIVRALDVVAEEATRRHL